MLAGPGPVASRIVADAPKSFHLSPAVHEYIVAHGTPPDEIEQWLIAETKTRVGDLAGMQIAPEQGAFMTVLTRLLGVRSAVEVGTFTGYSSLCIARGLASGGRLVCCDVSEEWTALAREAWDRAGVADRIDLRIAARDRDPPGAYRATGRSTWRSSTRTSPATPCTSRSWSTRLRPDGVILVDNTLWHGAVVDESATDDNTKAIRAFNDLVAADDRVDTVLLPISDGLTLLRKR